MNIYGVLEDQVGIYMQNKQEQDIVVGQRGNQISQALSIESNVTITTPLKQQVQSVELVNVFMNTILTTIVVLLAILSIQLIYSLMLSDVEEKTYEYGMLRALGFNKQNIMTTLVLSSLKFAIPGLIIGMAEALLLNFLMRHILYTLTQNSSTYWLSFGSVVVGVGIGLFMPLVANIFPIRKALSKELKDSLNLYRRSTGELVVRVTRLYEMGLSVN